VLKYYEHRSFAHTMNTNTRVPRLSPSSAFYSVIRVLNEFALHRPTRALAYHRSTGLTANQTSNCRYGDRPTAIRVDLSRQTIGSRLPSDSVTMERGVRVYRSLSLRCDRCALIRLLNNDRTRASRRFVRVNRPCDWRTVTV
jgi:hypothetical protein